MNTALVLEIGSSWIKMAVFRALIGNHYVKGVSAIASTDLGEDAIASIIADFLKEQRIRKPNTIVVSFSRNAVTLRNLRIPSQDASEIEDMIKLHVGRQVPYAKEEIVSGYRVVGNDSMGNSKVVLAIVHRESIRKIFRILEKINLYTEKVELSSDGTLSWLNKALKPAESELDSFIVLDVDSNYTDFIIATFKDVFFSRVVAQGRESLLDLSQWDRFIGEMKQTLVISQGEEVAAKPSRIYLTGACEGIEALAERIKTEFGLPVETVGILKNIGVSKELNSARPAALGTVSFTSLFGLGLDAGRKRINFVLSEALIRKALKERSFDMIALGSAVMYIILIICGVYLEKLHNRQAYLDILNDRYKVIEIESSDLNEKTERIKRIKARLDTESVPINYIYGISKIMPSEIDITSLLFEQGEKVTLKGRAHEMSDVFKFITILEDSPYLQDIQTRYTRRRKSKGKDVTEFELLCPLEMEAIEKRMEEATGESS